MRHFDVKDIDRVSLRQVLTASFPELSYELSDLRLTFDEINHDQEKIVRRLIKALEFSRTTTNTAIRYSSEYRVNRAADAYSDDVQIQLESKGEVVWIGSGLAMLSGDFLKVKRALEDYWRRYALDLNAVEIENPALWSPEIARRSEYLSDFPQEATFVFGAKKDGLSIAQVGELVADGHFPEGSQGLSAAHHSLRLLGFCQPSVCTSCYYLLGLQPKVSDSLYTTYNRVFRNEGSTRLDRLLSFSVRDVIAVGTEEYVRITRESFLMKAAELVEQLNIEASIVRATDPFFAAKSDKLFFQKMGDLKYEIQAWLPFEKKSLAVGSINLHLETFAKRFKINTEEGVASSACFGIGFERLTYVLFAQNGPELANWPNTVLVRLGLH
jgi:seryl-tRNA synthetase